MEIPLVVHYAGESMASGIAGDIRTGSGTGSCEAAVAELRQFLAKLESRLDQLEAVELPATAPPCTALQAFRGGTVSVLTHMAYS